MHVKRILVLAALAVLSLPLFSSPARAGVYVGVGVGRPGPYYGRYYSYRYRPYRGYYYGPRVVIAAPPVVVAPAAPPPVVIAPAPAPVYAPPPPPPAYYYPGR
jgi:hypothetical protein